LMAGVRGERNREMYLVTGNELRNQQKDRGSKHIKVGVGHKAEWTVANPNEKEGNLEGGKRKHEHYSLMVSQSEGQGGKEPNLENIQESKLANHWEVGGQKKHGQWGLLCGERIREMKTSANYLGWKGQRKVFQNLGTNLKKKKGLHKKKKTNTGQQNLGGR